IINAELAMYQAKLEGRNTYCFFNNKIKAKLNNDREISESLKPAMDRKELYLVFQPQIDILSGKITGAEALLRWESKEHGNIPPGVFIPIAEATGLIYDIGNWVLEEACSHCKRWNDEGMELSVAVNVSPVQIKREGFCEEVMNILKKTEIPPDKLQLEITECSLVQNFSKAASMLSFFKERGVRVALDDFGTGYSSFSYLKQLPIDVIKIDREYIKNLEADVRERAITGSIIALTHVLGMEVIAEGIETKEQFEYLKKIGCNTAQGYYLSKPLKLEDFKIFLQKKQWCA
ncbi:MAG: GGDEF domain-containing phosphodiesterase, partial [Clostridia bacterium]|nr:GGDEF domain-containing phosphodiesterase [Clostridia bacterium]